MQLLFVVYGCFFVCFHVFMVVFGCFVVYDSLHMVVLSCFAGYHAHILKTQGPAMNIEEFEKQVQPRAKRSKLEPFKVQIFELKQKGYTNLQVSDWLASNGMHVSSEAVRKFIKTREGKEENTAAPGFGHDQETKPDSQRQTTQKGKAGSFEIPIPKKFVHNNRPDDDQLK